jgi:hypothetical protein
VRRVLLEGRQDGRHELAVALGELPPERRGRRVEGRRVARLRAGRQRRGVGLRRLRGPLSVGRRVPDEQRHDGGERRVPVRVGLDRVVPARRGPAVRRVDRVAQALATGVVDGRGREPLVAQQPRRAAERRRGDRLVLVDGEHAARGERRRRALVRDLQLPPGDDRVHELDDGLAHLRRAVGRVARDALDHLRHQGAVAAVRAELHEERDLRGLLVLVRRGGGLVEDRPRLAVDGLHYCSARQYAPARWLARQSVLGWQFSPATRIWAVQGCSQKRR